MPYNFNPSTSYMNQGTAPMMGNDQYDALVKRGIILPGQTIPGYDPSKLPQTLVPSMQYWQRMGPQSQQQYSGYQQAAHGWVPEESQWRVWQRAAPAAQNPGLRYRR